MRAAETPAGRGSGGNQKRKKIPDPKPRPKRGVPKDVVIYQTARDRANFMALAGIEKAIRDDEEAERKNRAANTVKNPDSARRTLTNRQILRYYLDRKAGRYEGKPKREFYDVQQIMDGGSLSKAQWQSMYRRWTKLHGVIFNPTPRQQEVGLKPGAIAKDSPEGRAIAIRTEVASIMQFIESKGEEEDVDDTGQ